MRNLITIFFLLISHLSFGQSPIENFWMMNKPYASSDSASFVDKVISNGGSLTSTEKTAIGHIITKFKDSSLWYKINVAYPLVGGSSASCKVNLRNPNAYSITFTGCTFASTGVDFNGTSDYANTNFNPNGILSLNSCHFSYYSRENTSGTFLDFGSTISPNYFALGIQNGYSINSTSATSFSNPNSSGLFTLSRTGSTATSQYRNGASVASSTTISTAIPNGNLFFGARNLNGSAANFTNRECAFITIGSGLTAAEAATLNNIIQGFQTELGR